LEVDIPVIYLTAYADPDSLRRAKITEPFGYIIKPYEDRDLHSTIEMALYKHEIESRLRWSEQWLATTLKCIGDGIIATDVAGTVTFMNPVAETLTGWKQGDALGRDLTMVFQIKCDDVETATAGIVQAVLKDGTSVTLSDHIFLVAKDESQLPIEVKATPIANVREHVLGLVLIFHDMTERKRVEEALRRSERSLAIKSQIANIFLTIPDEEMYGEVLKVILGVMKSPQGFFGYLEEKGVFVVPSLTKGIMSKCGVIGKTHEFLPKHCSGLWGRALREQQTYCSNGPFYLPEGHIQINCFLTVPVCFRGETIGLLGVANKEGQYDPDDKSLLESIAVRIAPILNARLHRDREEKERRNAEEALADQKERLNVTLNSIGDGVIATDTTGTITLMNRIAEDITGWARQDAIDNKLETVFHVFNEKTRERCESPLQKVLKTGGIIELAKNTILLSRDGKERVVADSCAPIRDRESRIVGMVLVFRDVTDRRTMESDLLKAQKLESIGLLAGGIAHDFNNLLTGALGNISLALAIIPPGDKVATRLASAEQACLRAKDLTQQLLTFSRGGAPVRQAMSIAALIRDSAGFSLSGKNIKCEFAIADDLWPAEVDAGQISQVINNLIINAVQAMPEGGMIEIACNNIFVPGEDSLPLKDGKYIRLSISDSGAGIPKENLARIFDPYFTTKNEGKGLGLAMVYSIVRNHEGHITAASTPGEGTTFTIYLPAAEAAVVECKVDEIRMVDGIGRVLVMDDEEHIRDVTGEMLDYIGYDVAFAKDGTQAVELFVQARESVQPFTAVIMDLTIPGGRGGKETIKLLREIDPEVKAIVSSGYSNDPIMSDYKAYGFSGVITKPYKVTELRKVLHKVLENC